MIISGVSQEDQYKILEKFIMDYENEEAVIIALQSIANSNKKIVEAITDLATTKYDF